MAKLKAKPAPREFVIVLTAENKVVTIVERASVPPGIWVTALTQRSVRVIEYSAYEKAKKKIAELEESVKLWKAAAAESL